MQHTKISRLEMFLERCCITVECGRKMLASECLLHQGRMRKEEVSGEGFEVRDVASRRHAEEVSSEGLLHC